LKLFSGDNKSTKTLHKKLGKKNTIFKIILLLFITFCVQFTDLKIGFVKITELLLLAITPFVLLGKINKYVLYFLMFFSFMAFLGILTTYTLEFTYIEPSFFKRPYWITLGRYLEIVTCMTLCNIGILYFQYLRKNEEFDKYIIKFIDLNIIIAFLFAFIYLLVIFNIISIDDTRLVYGWDARLRGYFAEGGPFGLMLSFFFILTKYVKNTRGKLLRRIFLFLVIFFMAESKAGTLCCLVWLGIENFGFVKNKLKRLLIPILAIFFIGFVFIFININSMYVRELERVRQAVLERPTDRNLILGRMSGFFITPKMIKKNTLIGIGTGNYPLLRNNKEYRGFFPLPPKKIRNIDAHGYGGIMDIIVDNGILGIMIFFLILLKIFGKYRKEKGKIELLLGFIILFLFGVQIHFMYPWLLLSLILVKTFNNDEAGRRLKINT